MPTAQKSKPSIIKKKGVELTLLAILIVMMIVFFYGYTHPTSSTGTCGGFIRIEGKAYSYEDYNNSSNNGGGWYVVWSATYNYCSYKNLTIEIKSPDGRSTLKVSNLNGAKATLLHSSKYGNFHLIIAGQAYFINDGTRTELTTTTVSQLDLWEVRSIEGVKLMALDKNSDGVTNPGDSVYVFRDFNGDGKRDFEMNSTMFLWHSTKKIGEVKLDSNPLPAITPYTVEVEQWTFPVNSTQVVNNGGWYLNLKRPNNMGGMLRVDPIDWDSVSFKLVSGSTKIEHANLGNGTATHHYAGTNMLWYIYGTDPIRFDDAGTVKSLEPANYSLIETIEFNSLESVQLVVQDAGPRDGILNDGDIMIVYKDIDGDSVDEVGPGAEIVLKLGTGTMCTVVLK